MNAVLPTICIFALIGIVVAGTVLITLVSIFVYNKWQNVLTLRQDLYNLEHWVLNLDFDIATFEREMNDIQTAIDENALRISQGTNNRNIQIAIANNECDINLLTEQICNKKFEKIGIQREILSIQYDINNWLM